MLFNSYLFILFFLPVTLFLYFGLNRLGRETWAKWALIVMSLWFYAYFHLAYLFLLAASILVNFLCVLGMRRVRSGGGSRAAAGCRWILAVGIAFDLGAIFYFKYFNFFLENANALFHLDLKTASILMPLGISFFTFQQISYLVDSFRMQTGEDSFTDYALFVSFFPQLVAGPIVLQGELIPQFHDKARKKLSQEKLAAGIYLFATGLFKKVMIADVLSSGVDWGFASPELLSAPDVVIVSLLYTLQIYFDFSGYCDMACGLANMFHLDLPVNFNSPYKAASILEFWQRWHMTLTRFLRTYIYFPLGGSRRGKARAMANTMIVFVVSGIWHGAAWSYVVWGVIHGAACVLCRQFQRVWDKFPRLLRWAVTFVFVDLTMIVFRAESLKDAGILLGKLIRPWQWQVGAGLLGQFQLLEFVYVEEHIAQLGAFVLKFPALHLVICLLTALFAALIPRNCHEKRFVPSVGNALSSVVLLVWSILSFSGLSAFLYFNF